MQTPSIPSLQGQARKQGCPFIFEKGAFPLRLKEAFHSWYLIHSVLLCSKFAPIAIRCLGASLQLLLLDDLMFLRYLVPQLMDAGDGDREVSAGFCRAAQLSEQPRAPTPAKAQPGTLAGAAAGTGLPWLPATHSAPVPDRAPRALARGQGAQGDIEPLSCCSGLHPDLLGTPHLPFPERGTELRGCRAALGWPEGQPRVGKERQALPRDSL